MTKRCALAVNLSDLTAKKGTTERILWEGRERERERGVEGESEEEKKKQKKKKKREKV